MKSLKCINLQNHCHTVIQEITTVPLFNRPSVAGAVLSTPLSLINLFIDSLGDPFVQNIQDTVYPKP